ncbi:PAS domain S-box-containing protein [Desulfobaculum xiamenense]|uniref:histidine kinase n=1 Tax=Desulfobaculum xiamenense TaxID=995050 RepID=A0A846QUX0_9BACT|nr:ATP-binding protein [Desulfobaculum xiamenense]NJB68439.1 PAS domain S-box-containing protein [Desulfobaculum xiamenense]
MANGQWTLKHKLNVAIIATFLLIAAVAVVVLSDLQRTRMTKAIDDIRLLLETIVQRDLEPLSNELFEGRIRALELRIHRMLDVRGVLEVEVHDAQGSPLVSTTTANLDQIAPLSPDEMHGLEGKAVISNETWGGQSTLVFAREIRIIGTQLGFISIRYALGPVELAELRTRQVFIGLFLAILLTMLVVLNASLSRMIIDPIRALRDVLNEMRSGNLDLRVKTKSSDEVGELGKAFNEMSAELSATYREVDAKNGELRERNAALRNEITERRRAEEEALRLQRLLADVFDSMPSILVSVNPDGTVSQWNLRAQASTGLNSHDAQGRHLTEVFPRLGREMDNVARAIREKTPFVTQRLSHQKDGETRFEDVTVYPLMAEGVSGAVIRMDDVTERVRIEEMMIQTEKMLSVGGLAAGMAHEINNPLGVILQGVQNIERRLLPDIPANVVAAQEVGCSLDKVREYLDKRKILRMLSGMRDAGKRAARIVSNMLDFSRKSESRMGPHDLATIVDDTLELAANDYDLKKKYDFRKIIIEREMAQDMPSVVCIRTEIEQVLLNILRNATQAMAMHGTGEAEPHLVLRTYLENGHAVIEVQDNGPGMDAALQKRIFEPFYTTKPPGVGTGLGLSVSYFIITQNHGGEFHVRSEPGQGATFIIRLPLGARQTGEGDPSLRV